MTKTDVIPRSDGRINFSRTLLLIVFAGLMLLTLTRSFLLLTDIVPQSLGSTIRQTGYAALIVIAAAAAWADKRFARMVVAPLPVLIALLWCWFSAAWSPTPGVTIQRLVVTSAVIWLAFLCTDRIGTRRAVLVAQAALLAALVVNYAGVLLDPVHTIHEYLSPWSRGLWRGYMGHKNIAGTMGALTALMFVFHGSPATRLPRYAVALAAAVFVGFTQSRTSMLALGGSLVVGILVLRLAGPIARTGDEPARTRFGRIGLGIAALVVLGLLFLTIDGELLLDATRNPKTWSGRAQIWQPMIVAYLERPFFGTGYGAFWSETAGAAAMAQDASRLGGVTQGHNGYLDLATQVGLPGLLLVLAAMAAWPVAMAARVARADPPVCALAMALLFFYLADNLTETSLFDGDQIPHVFAVMALALLAATVRRRATANAAPETTPAPDRSRRRRRRRSTSGGARPVTDPV